MPQLNANKITVLHVNIRSIAIMHFEKVSSFQTCSGKSKFSRHVNVRLTTILKSKKKCVNSIYKQVAKLIIPLHGPKYQSRVKQLERVQLVLNQILSVKYF